MSDRKYFVVEVFPTVQGEGVQAGRRAVFLRLAGCNLWSGRARDRGRGPGACSLWCDTRFTGGQAMSVGEVVEALVDAWGASPAPGPWYAPIRPLVVVTGGEPTLQLDVPLVQAIKQAGFAVALETNGTNVTPALDFIDHVCVSPKRGGVLRLMRGSELKVVLPGVAAGAGWADAELVGMAEQGSWGALYVQPQDVVDQTMVAVSALTSPHMAAQRRQVAQHVQLCLEFIDRNPEWRLSAQTHKFIGVR